MNILLSIANDCTIYSYCRATASADDVYFKNKAVDEISKSKHRVKTFVRLIR